MNSKCIFREKDNIGGTKIKVNNICLDRIVDVNNFAELMGSVPNQIFAHSESYVVNAKSLLGLCSLNLVQPIWIDIYDDVDDKFLEKVSVFVKDENEQNVPHCQGAN